MPGIRFHAEAMSLRRTRYRYQAALHATLGGWQVALILVAAIVLGLVAPFVLVFGLG